MSDRVLVTKDFTDEIDELISLANTDKDDEELKGILVTSFDFKLYFVIRKYIDWETGWVGEKGVAPSRHTLIKAMQEKRVYGSNKEVLIVTEGVIRASIKRLEKAGFLVVHSVNTKDDKRLIFFMPKAIEDKSVSFTNNRGTTDSELPEENIDFTGVYSMGTTGEQPTTNARYHIEHNIYKSKDLYIGEENKAVKKKRKGRTPGVRTLVPEDFQVTQEHVDFARQFQTPDPHKQRMGFITYWQAQRKMRPDWNASFKNWLLKAKEIEEAKAARFAKPELKRPEGKNFTEERLNPQQNSRQKEIDDLKEKMASDCSIANDDKFSDEIRKNHRDSYFECKKKLEALGVTL
jgi:hypothetical protein